MSPELSRAVAWRNAHDDAAAGTNTPAPSTDDTEEESCPAPSDSTPEER